MRKCLADQCLFGRKTKKGTVLLAIHIDDTLCVGKQEAIDELKLELATHFATKEKGGLKEYVGCEIVREGKTKLLMRQQVLLRMIKRIFGKTVEKLTLYKTLSGTGFRVERFIDENEKMNSEKQTLYRSSIVILLFLVKCSRPDISNSVRELSKANDGANANHFNGLLRTIKYVLDTIHKALRYEIGKTFQNTWKLKCILRQRFCRG